MQTIPLIISILFITTTLFTIWSFYKASGDNKTVISILLILLLFQGIFGYTGFFKNTNTIPPRFILLIGIPLIVILFLFINRKGKEFLDRLSLKYLTLLHVVRIPVEISLFYLFIGKLIPESMTFEGYNFDIISGISAIFIYFALLNNKLNTTVLLIWNCFCLGLLINIVSIAILSAQTPFQQLAFDQPNIGVTIFPFVWLPGLIVPLVLLSHLVSIRQLVKGTKSIKSNESLQILQ